MHMRKVLGAAVLGLALSLAGGAGLSISNVLAQDSPVSVDHAASIRQALEQQLGKRAKLKLVSGQDLEGKVVNVGEKVVQVSELTGMEYFGATVRLDQVAAVIVRAGGQ
ncbi:MAG: hypothetical protein MUE63_05495 [Xanthomonadales bacterium]|jgi:hypothetical protein|nr:hypothetical protein [Xanthomonadales bacterium]